MFSLLQSFIIYYKRTFIENIFIIIRVNNSTIVTGANLCELDICLHGCESQFTSMALNMFSECNTRYFYFNEYRFWPTTISNIDDHSYKQGLFILYKRPVSALRIGENNIIIIYVLEHAWIYIYIYMYICKMYYIYYRRV